MDYLSVVVHDQNSLIELSSRVFNLSTDIELNSMNSNAK